MDCFDAFLFALVVLGGIGVFFELWRLRLRQTSLEERVDHLTAQARARQQHAERDARARPEPTAPEPGRPGAPASEARAAPPGKARAATRPAPRPKDGIHRRTVSARPAAESAPPVSDSADDPAGDPAPPVPFTPAPRSVESLVGGRVLLIAGVVVVLFGLAFFLKYAIDREWLGPGGRIVLGVLAGLGATFGGDRIRAGGRHAYGTALMGAGLGALYLSIHFATARYGFLTEPAGFALTALVTAAAASLALLRNAPLLAYLGFLGGFLAPALLGSGKDVLGPLVLWQLFVEAGVLAVLWVRRWNGLELMALATSAIYFAGWQGRFMAPGRELAAFGALTALLAGVAVLCILPSIAQARRLPATSLLALGAASFAYVVAGHDLLFPAQRQLLGVAVLALAGLHFATAVRARDWSTREHPDSHTLSVFGIASVAAALPILLEGRVLPPAWAAAGCAAVFLAAQWRRAELAAGGLFMIVLALVALFERPLHPQPFTPFVNIDFWVWASPVAALILAGRALSHVDGWWRRFGALVTGAGVWLLAPLLGIEVYAHFRRGSPPASYSAIEHAWASATALVCVYAGVVAWIAREREGLARVLLPAGPLALGVLLGFWLAVLGHQHPFAPALNAVFAAGLTVAGAIAAVGLASGGRARKPLLRAALLYGLFLLTAEIFVHGERRALEGITRRDARYAAQIAISIVWTLYAAGLVGLGFARRSVELRWAGLAVFLLTLGKVFLFDMAALPAVHRIGSFLVLGLVCIGASFLYQRKRPD